MNLNAKVSSIMTTDLITIAPNETLGKVREIFKNNKINHIPVVSFTKIVGIISKVDYKHYMRGISSHDDDNLIVDSLLMSVKAKDIMTKGVAKVHPEDKLVIALDVFRVNLFHALPVVEDDELVGILTTYDVINKLLENYSVTN